VNKPADPKSVDPKPAVPPAKAPAAKPKPPTSALVAVADGPKPPVAPAQPPAPPPKKPKKKREPVVKPPEPPSPPVVLGATEVGVRAGWALARGRLEGQGLYLAEFGRRLSSVPALRVTLVGGYTLLSGQWTAIEAGRGLGSFTQETLWVPIEAGVTWEPLGAGGFSPYVGLSVAGGYVDTTVRRFSLKAQEVRGAALGATMVAGLRVQAGGGSFVLELRHSESVATLGPLAKVAQSTLSSSAVTGGYLFSF
jgi:hypothetical protein